MKTKSTIFEVTGKNMRGKKVTGNFLKIGPTTFKRVGGTHTWNLKGGNLERVGTSGRKKGVTIILLEKVTVGPKVVPIDKKAKAETKAA